MKMKKISKMKNNCTSMWNSGHFDRKAQAALALAVSLWIANGGVASAVEYVNVDTTVSTDESGKEYVLEGNTNAAKGEGITFTVENGGTVKKLMVTLWIPAATPSSSRRAARSSPVKVTPPSSAASATTK
jgi:hypothetical protein